MVKDIAINAWRVILMTIIIPNVHLVFLSFLIVNHAFSITMLIKITKITIIIKTIVQIRIIIQTLLIQEEMVHNIIIIQILQIQQEMVHKIIILQLLIRLLIASIII